MTREEAKTWLNKLYARADITDEYGDMEDMQPYEEAVNMAIKALEQEPTDENLHIEREQAYMQGYEDASKRFRQEPCDDVVSRQAVLEIIDKWYENNSQLLLNDCIEDLIVYVTYMLSVRPQEPKWIPVSERLPEGGENILFSTKTGRVFEGRYFDDNTEQQWYSFRDECFAWNNVVNAWKPLPEPYKVEPQESEDKE